MIPYPDINPEIIRIGPVSVRWYGLMYIIGFTASYFLVRYQTRKREIALSREQIDNLYTSLILGLILGARLGYTLFYNPAYYLYHPLEIFAPWHGGMSFHGGLIGAIAAGLIFTKRNGLNFWLLSDLVIVTAPIGLGFGRLGNFINGELYGRVTSAPWGIVFPGGGNLPRHPSQIYEFLLEGVALFIILWVIKDKNMRTGMLTSLFLIFYSIFRFAAEFFREPDAHIGFLSGWMTMGQILSACMLAAGIAVLYCRKFKEGDNGGPKIPSNQIQ